MCVCNYLPRGAPEATISYFLEIRGKNRVKGLAEVQVLRGVMGGGGGIVLRKRPFPTLRLLQVPSHV